MLANFIHFYVQTAKAVVKKFAGGDNFCAFFQSIYKSNSKLNDYEDCTTYTPVAGYLGELYYAELVLRLVLPVPRVPASPTAAPSPPPPSSPPLTPRTGAASRR